MPKLVVVVKTWEKDVQLAPHLVDLVVYVNVNVGVLLVYQVEKSPLHQEVAMFLSP